MVVLWLCNFSLPMIAEKIGEKVRVNEGWIQGLYGSLIDNALIDRIIYLFPQKTYIDNCTGRIGKLDYMGFYSSESNPSVVSKNLTALFEKIIQLHKVDVIHIMGTEYAHSVAMINAAENTGNLKRTIVSIQGMPSVYYKHYLLGVPEKVIRRKRIKDIVYHSDLIKQQQLMQKRGKSEEYVLSKAINVMGRTEWDAACTMQINAERKYFHGGEILRECFYQGAWDVNKINRHSVFISQATYPVKGFHFFVEAAGFLVTKYQDLQVYVGGRNIYSGPTWKKSSYEKYVCDLIEKYDLNKKITFTGVLRAEEMKEKYLTCNVFVSPSTIENSPNSVGEAMILGVPTITSDVGGVKDMLIHKKEGYIYPADEPYMLAFYIDQIFSSDELAQRLGRNAHLHAALTHNRESITKEVLETYKEIVEKGKS